ncbi:MAG: hypothetical protein N4A62_20545 [Marinisporobacter sp.]|jgi:nucleoid-associated protein YgaU|nr:hypothetical protein [Marinisporobacter sp.]
MLPIYKKATFYTVGSNGKGKKGQGIEVMFNPNTYSLGKEVKLSNKTEAGGDEANSQFLTTKADVLSLELFFDTYSTGMIEAAKPEILKKDVNESMKKITDLLKIDEHEHKPPEVIFVWGTLYFKGKVIKAERKYTMFTLRGKPVRATMNLLLEGIKTDKTIVSSPDRTKRHTLLENEMLWQLADQEYDDPSMWREIANENGIDNPRRIKKASHIKIPSI